jgi:hypothetical protein
MGRDGVVGSDSLRAGRSTDQIPVLGGGREFPHLPRPALGPTQSPVKWETGLFPGGKRPGGGINHPPHLAKRLKKK